MDVTTSSEGGVGYKDGECIEFFEQVILLALFRPPNSGERAVMIWAAHHKFEASQVVNELGRTYLGKLHVLKGLSTPKNCLGGSSG